MERKIIRLNQNTYKDLTFEEILEMYTQLIYAYVHDFQARFPFFMLENEDLYQEFSIALHKAYKRYDITKGVGFGLVAKRYLTHKSMNISKVYSATKRRNKFYHEVELEKFYSLEAPETMEECLSSIVIDNYINKLGERDKAVLKCKQKGMYIYEIKEKLNISRAWIAVITHRHKKNIKKELVC